MHKNQKARQTTDMNKSELFWFDEILIQSIPFWWILLA